MNDEYENEIDAEYDDVEDRCVHSDFNEDEDEYCPNCGQEWEKCDCDEEDWDEDWDEDFDGELEEEDEEDDDEYQSYRNPFCERDCDKYAHED